MASWQAHVTTWILKRKLKPKLAMADKAMDVRRLLRPEPFKVPRGVRITPKEVGGVPGEWVEAARSDLTLLYLHGEPLYLFSRDGTECYKYPPWIAVFISPFSTVLRSASEKSRKLHCDRS